MLPGCFAELPSPGLVTDLLLEFGHVEVGRASLPAMRRSQSAVVDQGNLQMQELANLARRAGQVLTGQLKPSSSLTSRFLRQPPHIFFGHHQGLLTMILPRVVLWEEAVPWTLRVNFQAPKMPKPPKPQGQSRNRKETSPLFSTDAPARGLTSAIVPLF